jgi:hypothetical protein
MSLIRVLITVKTYPTISSKYDELVCTAGFREDGSWIRIYPVPYRKKAYSEQYGKYDWIELDLVKNDRDFRPESFRPRLLESEIDIVGHIDTSHNWAERKSIVLKNVCYNLPELIARAKNNSTFTSLAVFKPSKILDFVSEKVDGEWSQSKIDKLKQLNLFDTSRSDNKLEVVRKLPYKFSYKLADDTGKVRQMMIEDWETGQLYWKQLAKYEGDEKRAIADVKSKYLDDLARTKDLYFFLGTTQVHHCVAPNPFIIIGAFYPKIELQGSLF